MSRIRPWTNGDQVALDGFGSVPTYLLDETGTPITEDNPLEVRMRPLGVNDTNNSTTALLLASETFTGLPTDVAEFVSIAIKVSSDVPSATDGLKIYYSEDGLTNWTLGEEYTYIDNGENKFFTPPAWSSFYYLTYENSATDQTTFDLSVKISTSPMKWSSHNINKPISGEDDAELVKAVLTGQDATGIFRNAKVDVTGRQEVVSQPYQYSVAEGTIPNHTSLLKFGTRTTVAANTLSTIWEGPTALYSYLPTAQQLKIVSTSASDTALGVGARTLYIEGLDANRDEINETVSMAGLGIVTTTLSYMEVYRAYVVTCGTSLTNVGTITISNNASTVTQAVINPGDAQTLMALWSVPAGHTLYLTQLSFSTDSNKGATISLFTREIDGGILYPWRIRYRAYTFGGNDQVPLNVPIKFPEKTDIEMRVLTPAAAGTTSAGATFEGWYELN